MTGETVLVTGATGGLGEATARAFAKAGARVVMLARNPTKLDAAAARVREASGNQNVETLTADLSDPASIRAAVDRFGQSHDKLHVLVNNAAVFKRERTLVGGKLEAMFATNHLGPFILTRLLLDKLKASAPAKILNVTAPSFTKLDFDDLQGVKWSAFTAFGASKMCNLLFTYELARRLEGSGVTVSAFHPGLVKSELMSEAAAPVRFFFRMVSGAPDRPAEGLVQLASRADLPTGGFFTRKKAIKSNAYSHDAAIQARLWSVSEQLIS